MKFRSLIGLIPLNKSSLDSCKLAVKILLLEKTANKKEILFNDEYQILHSLYPNNDTLETIYIVDIAASDGVSMSPVLPYFVNGASGLALEYDADKFAHLSFIYRLFPTIKLIRNKITPLNAAKVLIANETPENFEILNLDIDSFDLEVISKILSSGFKPKVISMEINEKIPPGIYFNVKYHEDHLWQGDHFYGCSLDAANDAVSLFGYRLVWLEYNNAFFVHEAYTDCDWSTLSTTDAYYKGYLQRVDMPQKFAYNFDVFSWNHTKTETAIYEISKYFSKYSGQFDLHEIDEFK